MLRAGFNNDTLLLLVLLPISVFVELAYFLEITLSSQILQRSPLYLQLLVL